MLISFFLILRVSVNLIRYHIKRSKYVILISSTILIGSTLKEKCPFFEAFLNFPLTAPHPLFYKSLVPSGSTLEIMEIVPFRTNAEYAEVHQFLTS